MVSPEPVAARRRARGGSPQLGESDDVTGGGGGPSGWKVEDSIWAPRAKWSDSKGLYDTDACYAKSFENGWTEMLSGGRLCAAA